MLAQVEIAEREQELIKGIELVRQKMVDSTAKAAQRIIELNDELAELEVGCNKFHIIYVAHPLSLLVFFHIQSSDATVKPSRKLSNGKILYRLQKTILQRMRSKQ